MLKEYLGISLFLAAGFIIPIAAFLVSRLFQTRRTSRVKADPYECGMETIGDTWVQFKSNYFLYALVFVAFDVETVFLYPWAVKFQQLGTFAFVEMFIFIAILVVGFWYAWKEGALEWK
ncbi:NADH-quinone oxidoreductase subunit A [Heliobacterium chlorum]|uniref:NADH-quinone oxidoreductase subunit A n=1 Tax=Heliobacterium chlorum TaxID=2698 RepID=A0ABR7T170_HELCL|nr:NADH-quinone oxidoreductase subunit A [Heliobacterium chlorum]MBC9783386.1 NADH-quinone oxidoreductase subunit A [Heliobacterium chlorum]